MKHLFTFLLALVSSGLMYAQSETEVYDEAGIIGKLKTKAVAAGYTQTFRLPGDTSRSFTAVPGKTYRLILVFKEGITAPGRRLVVYQRDKKNTLKRFFMAKKVNDFREFNGHAMVTDVPAQPVGETFLSMKIDALPVEGNLYIFSN
jgi:hypothetical protein